MFVPLLFLIFWGITSLSLLLILNECTLFFCITVFSVLKFTRAPAVCWLSCWRANGGDCVWSGNQTVSIQSGLDCRYGLNPLACTDEMGSKTHITTLICTYCFGFLTTLVKTQTCTRRHSSWHFFLYSFTAQIPTHPRPALLLYQTVKGLRPLRKRDGDTLYVWISFFFFLFKFKLVLTLFVLDTVCRQSK